jgi:hypothetical protein
LNPISERLLSCSCPSFFLLILIGFPLSAFAQFIDKGDRVEVGKGTKLCSNVKMEKARGLEIQVVYFGG